MSFRFLNTLGKLVGSSNCNQLERLFIYETMIAGNLHIIPADNFQLRNYRKENFFIQLFRKTPHTYEQTLRT